MACLKKLPIKTEREATVMAQRSKDVELVPRPAGSSETLLTTVWSHKIGKT